MNKLSSISLDTIMVSLAIFLYFSYTSPVRKLLVPSPIPKLKINKRFQGVDVRNPILHHSGYLIIDKKSNKAKLYQRKRFGEPLSSIPPEL
ncbi:hypothetical protein [Aquirufa rosea]|uniref:Uncharacterized protein n=1 Tax=Aquirufa rosea TaxID=2509241 RepID=A0A4Q1BX85_9BACT|nr:hypothetical protein [Aquirufa rosea]RXK46777.1 hypothetical protein ESB04_11460 [Aquirufa rosea]